MTRKRRAGLTLMEVLVSLAILAFGLLAIMTLFPLSAIQMGRAVRDDRSYLAARNADGMFRSYWKGEIVERAGNPVGEDARLFDALNDPDGVNNPALPTAQPNEWSYPVVVDPWGYVARGATRDLFGDGGATRVPRRTMNLFAGNPQLVLSALCLKDTMGFDLDMRPTADREYRYNWMWIIQRPVNSNRYAAYMTVVVFDDRPHLFAPPGMEVVFPSTTFTPGNTRVDVTHAANAGPDLKPGAWVMDATVSGLVRHANPYQVVSVTPDPSGILTTLELQTPVKPRTDNQTGGYTGTLVVLRGVSGAYTRSPLAGDQ